MSLAKLLLEVSKEIDGKDARSSLTCFACYKVVLLRKVYSLTDSDEAVKFIENAKEKVRLWIAAMWFSAHVPNDNTYEVTF